MSNEEKALWIEIQRLEAERNLMIRLATRQGFYDEYFARLKLHTTYVSAFNEVNELYFTLFKEYRYTDWNSFRTAAKRYHSSSISTQLNLPNPKNKKNRNEN